MTALEILNESPQVLIDQYLSAYEDANDRAADFTITYERGWVVFRSKSGLICTRHRRADLVLMTDRLLKRMAGN